jgi:hypothetical protein
MNLEEFFRRYSGLSWQLRSVHIPTFNVIYCQNWAIDSVRVRAYIV